MSRSDLPTAQLDVLLSVLESDLVIADRLRHPKGRERLHELVEGLEQSRAEIIEGQQVATRVVERIDALVARIRKALGEVRA